MGDSKLPPLSHAMWSRRQSPLPLSLLSPYHHTPPGWSTLPHTCSVHIITHLLKHCWKGINRGQSTTATTRPSSKPGPLAASSLKHHRSTLSETFWSVGTLITWTLQLWRTMALGYCVVVVIRRIQPGAWGIRTRKECIIVVTGSSHWWSWMVYVWLYTWFIIVHIL